VLACTITYVKSTFDSVYWSCTWAVVTALGLWQVGTDMATDALLAAAGGAAVFACWKSTQHLAQWLAGGVAGISGALLTLAMEAAMNGAPHDPSTVSLVFSFAGAAAVSGVLHNRIAQAQAARDRELDKLLRYRPQPASVRWSSESARRSSSHVLYDPARGALGGPLGPSGAERRKTHSWRLRMLLHF
jgi:hypothetical protein